MGNVYQAHISASQKQLLQDSSHGFILKRNVCGLTWRRERREAGSLYSGSPGASLEITGTSTWLSELRHIYFSSYGAYGFGCWDCLSVRGLQLPTAGTLWFNHRELFRSCHWPDHSFRFVAVKSKENRGLSWGVLSLKRLFLLEKCFLGWFDLQCFRKSGEPLLGWIKRYSREEAI